MPKKNYTKSLGSLRVQKKTKSQSPDFTGMMRLQRHTLESLLQQLNDDKADETTGNLAGWINTDKKGQFLTVELSPRNWSHSAEPKPSEGPFSTFFQDDDQ